MSDYYPKTRKGAYSRCSVCGNAFHKHTGDSGVGCPLKSDERELARQRKVFFAKMKRLERQP